MIWMMLYYLPLSSNPTAETTVSKIGQNCCFDFLNKKRQENNSNLKPLFKVTEELMKPINEKRIAKGMKEKNARASNILGMPSLHIHKSFFSLSLLIKCIINQWYIL